MSNNSKTSTNGGIGFCGLLAIVFITLKLTGVINWSWFWVLCPLWWPIAALCIAFLGLVIYAVLKK